MEFVNLLIGDKQHRIKMDKSNQGIAYSSWTVEPQQKERKKERKNCEGLSESN
jgi:hypothetical protein